MADNRKIIFENQFDIDDVVTILWRSDHFIQVIGWIIYEPLPHCIDSDSDSNLNDKLIGHSIISTF